jgi:hypothetical protein
MTVEDREFNAAPGEFDYKPVPVLAPLSLFLAVCSSASFLSVYALAIGVAAVITSVCCLVQIRRSTGELGGRKLTFMAFGLAMLFSVGGSSWHGYVYATEVPEGAERVSFSWLAKQAPYYENGQLRLADAALDLDGKHVFIKGYMYPTRQTTGLTTFLLLKDTGQCCFGGQPKETDMIVVEMQGDKTVDHKEMTLVSLAGTLRANPVMKDGQLTLYRLEANHFR